MVFGRASVPRGSSKTGLRVSHVKAEGKFESEANKGNKEAGPRRSCIGEITGVLSEKGARMETAKELKCIGGFVKTGGLGVGLRSRERRKGTGST